MPTGNGRYPPQRSAGGRRPAPRHSRPAGARRERHSPRTRRPQVFERVPLIEPVEAVHQIGLLSGQPPPIFPSRAWRRGRSCSTRVCTWASSASESRPSSSPSWAGGQRIGGWIFHRYARGCGKLLRLFAASQEKQGEQRQEGAALDHGITSVLDYFRHCTTGR